jgi:hypothetical protein
MAFHTEKNSHKEQLYVQDNETKTAAFISFGIL